ncbi:universal stress protein [Mariniflexile soesokkakense]|uniref:Universal stress protein n=1 Tax=Mariniflexile soesokkakense TaxID=1343160 RepID=A0ABV0A8H7_9FLAO
MKKILLPTDFSDNSWNAIKYALSFFKESVCHFYLIHTYTPVVYQIEYMEVSTAQFGLLDAMKETAKKGLEKVQMQIDEEFKNSKHSFTQLACFNTLTAEISEQTSKNDVDYVVMGTKGATGAVGILFGSNTMHAIKNAKCAVLAVPSDFTFEKPTEVLFPSDYQVEFQEQHVKPILDVATMFHSRVNILNASFGYDLSDYQESNKKLLETYFNKITHLFHSISNQTVEEAIAKFQLKHRINLLVMINNKHSFFENLFFRSTINHIGFHLNIPFLVIPSKILK